MPKTELTSAQVGRLAARALKRPEGLSYDEIKALAASALTQRPNKVKAKKSVSRR